MQSTPYNLEANHNGNLNTKHNKKTFTIIALVAILLIGMLSAGYYYLNNNQTNPSQNNETTNSNTATPASNEEASASTTISVIEDGQLVLPNGHADPTVLKTDAGYRMYVNRQSGGPTGILSYVSADGIAWTKEQDLIIPGASTSRAVQFPTGVRLYYPGPQPINPGETQSGMLSQFSLNGKNFTAENDAIIKPRSPEYYVEGPTVFQLQDGSWRMYFNENSVAAANQRDGVIWGASSADGQTWTRDEQPTLSANDVENTYKNQRAPWDQVLHPFVVANPKGGYIMFYNSHSEIFAATSEDGKSWEKIGGIGIHGADIDGFFIDDTTMRVYYGDFSQETGGLVYSAIIKIN